MLLGVSCSHKHDNQSLVDKYNKRSFLARYRNVDQTWQWADSAYLLSADYPTGKACALNNKAYVCYQRMDYQRALSLLDSVQEVCNNQVELLCADVMRMKIYQRTGDGLKFFNNRSLANRRIKRIEEEKDYLSDKEKERYSYALSEMHIILSTYYYYQQQDSLSRNEIDQVRLSMQTASDTIQWLYYEYMLGSGGMLEGEAGEVTLTEFDYLTDCYALSRRQEQHYFEANALQALASLMDDPERLTFLLHERPYECDALYSQHLSWYDANDSLVIDRLSKALANHALNVFRFYGDRFQEACVLRTMATIEMNAGKYTEALDCLDEALAIVEQYKEITLPEWMAGIYQQLSLVCSLMGNSKQSLVYREVYLHSLSLTNQNREMESRTNELKVETQGLYQRIVFTCVLLVLLLLFIYFFIRKNRVSAKLDDERQMAEDDLNLSRLHIEQGKQKNADRRAKVSMAEAVLPFLDRIRYQMDVMLKHGVSDKGQIDYIGELNQQIMQINDRLTEWIRINQGDVRLQLSTIPLNELFSVLAQGHYTFDQAGVTLSVIPTDVSVKGDRALTMFMLNTLADNARKFTPVEGQVTVSEMHTDQYVEVSIEDTGCGLNEEDLYTLNNSKVYDPEQIGKDNAGAKGFGFGLMNCRGIIEKYKKTSQLFNVCDFGVESQKGKGSRFWFRLPRVLTMIVMLLLFTTKTHAIQTMDSLQMEISQALVEGDVNAYHSLNDKYTRLYREANRDDSLPMYCDNLARVQSNSRLVTIVLTLLAIGVVFLFLRVIYGKYAKAKQAIELIHEEQQRLAFEENKLHVQNQVLDNCLSTIKHESMYYPARIAQLQLQLQSDHNTDLLLQMSDLVHYYRDLYFILCLQARQVTEMQQMRRSEVELQGLLQDVIRYYKNLTRKKKCTSQLTVTHTVQTDSVASDPVLLPYLIYNILEWMCDDLDVKLNIDIDGRFLRLVFLQSGRMLTDDECHNLFYAQQGQYPLLVAKQIVRDMDALYNHQGASITAVSNNEGVAIIVVVPTQQKN